MDLGGNLRFLFEQPTIAAQATEIERSRGIGELTELPPGRVGEIWVKGPSVCAGYWANPIASRETFRAAISGAAGPDASGWLRTGDLGVLDGGQLYVTGRLKEMILINGRNLYPRAPRRAGRSRQTRRNY